MQDTVNNWKACQTGIFGDPLGYGDGIKIADLKMPFSSASVMKRLNNDM